MMVNRCKEQPDPAGRVHNRPVLTLVARLWLFSGDILQHHFHHEVNNLGRRHVLGIFDIAAEVVSYKVTKSFIENVEQSPVSF